MNRFDLERAIANWRAPFSVRHYYSGDDVSELEWHLRDAVADEMAEGLSEQEAYWLAVPRVGDESLLRSQYRQSWKETNPFKRYWRRFRAELSGLTTLSGRTMYVIARLYTLLIGAWGLMYLVALPLMFARGLLVWNPSEPIIYQGAVFLMSIGFLAFFNFIPFERWQNSIVNWLRLSHTAILLILVMSTLIWSNPLGLEEHVAMLFGCFTMFISPALWLSQLFGRRDVRSRSRSRCMSWRPAGSV